jgi:hypothetical protein
LPKNEKLKFANLKKNFLEVKKKNVKIITFIHLVFFVYMPKYRRTIKVLYFNYDI